ncbi:hypothetical protein FAIPA1_20421 [Frankia sp. AiPs1]
MSLVPRPARITGRLSGSFPHINLIPAVSWKYWWLAVLPPMGLRCAWRRTFACCCQRSAITYW